MNEKLSNFVNLVKSLLYIAATASLGYTYLNKDALLKKLAGELHPYTDVQVDESVKKYVPDAVKVALESDDVVIKIDEQQFRQFGIMLNDNKREILEATEESSERMAGLVLHNFLVVEREITDPVTKKVMYIKGILIGKDELGRDEWIFRVSETKSN